MRCSSRVFRRRRHPGALARLLGGVTDSCQSWLDQKIFRGVFGPEDQKQSWDTTSPEGVQLNNWSELDDAELHKSRGFTYGQ